MSTGKSKQPSKSGLKTSRRSLKVDLTMFAKDHEPAGVIILNHQQKALLKDAFISRLNNEELFDKQGPATKALLIETIGTLCLNEKEWRNTYDTECYIDNGNYVFIMKIFLPCSVDYGFILKYEVPKIKFDSLK